MQKDLVQKKTTAKKTNYILNYIDFFEKLNGRIPSRNELLAIKGIGPETADSMLLYGFNQREFKIDAYTKRVLVYLKIFDEKSILNKEV